MSTKPKSSSKIMTAVETLAEILLLVFVAYCGLRIIAVSVELLQKDWTIELLVYIALGLLIFLVSGYALIRRVKKKK